MSDPTSFPDFGNLPENAPLHGVDIPVEDIQQSFDHIPDQTVDDLLVAIQAATAEEKEKREKVAKIFKTIMDGGVFTAGIVKKFLMA